MSVSLQGHCTFVIVVSGVALTTRPELGNQGRVRIADHPPAIQIHATREHGEEPRLVKQIQVLCF
jgi:hypothetical protein